MSDSYEVDPELLPQAIADLKLARGQLQSIRTTARELMMNPPGTGEDQVSKNAGTELSRVAGDASSGSLIHTVNAYEEAIVFTIEQFESMLASYLQLEDTNQLKDFEVESSPFSESPSYEERQRAQQGHRHGSNIAV